MFITIDIETAANPDMEKHLPKPEPSKTLKDPAKIEADIEKKRAKQREDMALDPLYGRIVSFASKCGEKEFVVVSEGMDDDCERAVLTPLLKVLGKDDVRLVTFNGRGFDLPFIYKRAILLGLSPQEFNAPPLSHWNKRYNNDKHYDLMQIWCEGTGDRFAKMDTLASVLLGESKMEIDYTMFGTLVNNEEGRALIADYNMKDVRLQEAMFLSMQGTLFV